MYCTQAVRVCISRLIIFTVGLAVPRPAATGGSSGARNGGLQETTVADDTVRNVYQIRAAFWGSSIIAHTNGSSIAARYLRACSLC